jgi:predicted dehydrogenase
MVPRRPDVVLWGAGMVAGVHAAACQSLGWKVRAVASRQLDRAAALARTVDATPMSFDEALGSTNARRGRLGDLAIVATPPAAHVADAIRLLDAGYQVVVEAPIACTLDEADRLVAAEQHAGRAVLYSEPLVASPVVDGLLSEVASLGPLTHLSARALQAPPTWRGTDRQDWGGGALFDLGVHPVGLVLRTAVEAGVGDPVSLSALVTDAGTDREHGTVKLHFASGLLATVVVGWEPGGAASWDLQASSVSGVVRADMYPQPSLERNGDPVPAGPPRLGGGPSLVDDYGYAPQLMRFWTNIRTGRPVPATSHLGRAVLDVIAAAHWSAGRNAVEVSLPFEGPRNRTPRQLATA